MFTSIRGRVLVNVEAMNMTESVGNYVKRRRVPVILPSGGYTVFFVPAISGESIAHGFQEILAKIAADKNLPVCSLCSKGIFLKSTNEEILKEAFKLNNLPKNEKDVEKTIVTGCVVEDIGGFLYAPRGGGQVKRTSHFSTGYMIPVKEALETTVIEPQLHSRYALGTPFVKRGGERRQTGQMIYYVEMASSVYTFSLDLDTTYVGKATFDISNSGELLLRSEDERKLRIETALRTIEKLILEFMFGAKKTRFLPVVEWESLIMAVSDDTWTVTSPNTAKYLENSIRKVEKYNPNVKLFIYVNPDVLAGTSRYVEKKTEELVETMKQVLERWKKSIKEKLPEYADKINWDEIVKEKLENLVSKRLEEVVESRDLTYISAIQEKYRKAYERAQEKENVKIYDDLATCIIEAVEEELGRL